MQVRRKSIFIFFILTIGSHELEKDVVKKKLKNYGKADTESKTEIKKDAIQSSDKSIQLHEEEQKSLQEKMSKLNEKQQDLAMN
jgi:adenylate kinase